MVRQQLHKLSDPGECNEYAVYLSSVSAVHPQLCPPMGDASELLDKETKMHRKILEHVVLIQEDARSIGCWTAVRAELSQWGEVVSATVGHNQYIVVEEYKAVGPPRGSRLVVLAMKEAVSRGLPFNRAYQQLKGSTFCGPLLLARINNRRRLTSPFVGRADHHESMKMLHEWMTASTTVRTWTDMFTNEDVAVHLQQRVDASAPDQVTRGCTELDGERVRLCGNR